MYTLELYKADKRKKQGERLEFTQDGIGALGSPLQALELHYAAKYPDTPYYCSPSSETYWSM